MESRLTSAGEAIGAFACLRGRTISLRRTDQRPSRKVGRDQLFMSRRELPRQSPAIRTPILRRDAQGRWVWRAPVEKSRVPPHARQTSLSRARWLGASANGPYTSCSQQCGIRSGPDGPTTSGLNCCARRGRASLCCRARAKPTGRPLSAVRNRFSSQRATNLYDPNAGLTWRRPGSA